MKILKPTDDFSYNLDYAKKIGERYDASTKIDVTVFTVDETILPQFKDTDISTFYIEFNTLRNLESGQINFKIQYSINDLHYSDGTYDGEAIVNTNMYLENSSIISKNVKFNIGDYYTITEIENLLNYYEKKEDLDASLNNYYTKNEIDNTFIYYDTIEDVSTKFGECYEIIGDVSSDVIRNSSIQAETDKIIVDLYGNDITSNDVSITIPGADENTAGLMTSEDKKLLGSIDSSVKGLYGDTEQINKQIEDVSNRIKDISINNITEEYITNNYLDSSKYDTSIAYLDNKFGDYYNKNEVDQKIQDISNNIKSAVFTLDNDTSILYITNYN